MKILTWHVHGSYLYYLSQLPHDFYLPVLPGRPEGYVGRTPSYSWPDNIHEIPFEDVKRLDLDCVLFQSRNPYLKDRFKILSAAQASLPTLYLEHDPPRDSPTDTRHIVDDPNTVVVHVTPFNRMMWDCGASPTRVIEHGVMIPEEIRYDGTLARGIAVINNMKKRGRRLGADIFHAIRESVPVDLVGMAAVESGGLGEVSHRELPEFLSKYRFFFNPIRYTSLGLAVCEAMMVGLPIIGLATTEMVTVIQNGVSGFLDTEPSRLLDRMRDLIRDPKLAREIGAGARRAAQERFSIERFKTDWNRLFQEAAA